MREKDSVCNAGKSDSIPDADSLFSITAKSENERSGFVLEL